MDNKYFTPALEDIRVGYECEHLMSISTEDGTVVKTDFMPYVFKRGTIYTKGGDEIKNVLTVDVNPEYIRVPYLTKEQIEAEGWKADDRFAGFVFTKEVKWNDGVTREIEMKYLFDTKMLYLGYDSGEFFLTGVFEGECKDINTFRYICKLLNI